MVAGDHEKFGAVRCELVVVAAEAKANVQGGICAEREEELGQNEAGAEHHSPEGIERGQLVGN